MQTEYNDLYAIIKSSSDPYQRIMAADALRYALVRDGDVERGLEIADSVIDIGLPLLEDKTADKHTHLSVYNALERAYITKAPYDFHSYLIALEWKRPAKARFYQPRMKVLKPVVDDLTDMMIRDKYDIILFSMPPRVGKSTLGLFFISWCAGRRPDDPILAIGYAEKITKMFHTGLTEVYEDEQYNYREIFSTLALVDTSAKDLTLDFRDDGHKATRKYKSITCRPIDGSLTGATEARQLLYCDDLVRDIEEAMNPARLQMLREKMVTNAYSRKKEGCKELHIGTRWSIHDPIGWVEAQNADNPRCKVVRLPALDEMGESNFNYPFKVGFSTEFYETVKSFEDDVTWNCVYQQQPIEREGLVFPTDSLTYYHTLPPTEDNPPDDRFAFCDVAFGGNDYLAMPIAYQWGDDPPVIVDVVFLKGDYQITEPMVAGKLIEHNVSRVVFEANNGGDFYSRDISALLKDSGYQIHLVAKRAESNKSKDTRIIQHSPAIKSFQFHDPSSASQMYKSFLQNLTTYTANGKNLNDDAPDSLAGLAAMMRTNLNAKLQFFNRSHI